MTKLFSNNAETTLAAGITTTGQTSISVTDGSVFPNPVAPDYFIATITQAATETSWEEVKVTARSSNTLTVVRGQEGSAAATWLSGDKIEIRWTAAAGQDAANVAEAGTSIIDFGEAPGGNYAKTTIYGQTTIKSTSMVDAFIPAVASVDHTDMEHVISQIDVKCGNVIAGTIFDIHAWSPMRLSGRYNVNWIRTQ